ncbi:MAG: Similar to phosphoglycolate phosphatase, clustered with ubiquinone biosynthesis SAM-dependent O-methyltransferase [Candidatus Burkholderia crenata]|nr:MAG: Similar to phosphoglycolate phosphatase, clustered with ubiquinone biosynthesis SAM-dependent O-methyltransferase [Candidatus Burkholderia crenata]
MLPAPLLHAAELMEEAPERVVYVGDDLRDVQAGFAAGMVTVAAAYGYLLWEGFAADPVACRSCGGNGN